MLNCPWEYFVLFRKGRKWEISFFSFVLIFVLIGGEAMYIMETK